jgi:hypothetical protein
MDIMLHKKEGRGQADYGWLKTHYSFSFASWYDPERMGFGTLRVINDDTVAPMTGFDAHGHKDMEIITIVMRGAVTHQDSIGNTGEVRAGEIQTMSAGTGVVHSEKNLSRTEPLELFQIWIEPKKRGIVPSYAQAKISDFKSKNGLTLLASPAGSQEGLPIHQDAYIYLAEIESDSYIEYELIDVRHGVYAFVIDGNASAGEAELLPRDAAGFSNTEKIKISSKRGAKLLLIEVPME